jgi:G:T-mismatch repair DNA endonuclease (very short patch repair protein)
MTELEKFNQLKLDQQLLNKHHQNITRKAYVREFLTKEFLREVVSKYSLNYIAKKILQPKGYKTEAGTLLLFCKEYGIPTLSVQEQANNPDVRASFRKTCLEKYGVEHPMSKDTESYRKRNRTVKKRYGVDNVFQLESVQEKSKQSLLSRYGVSSPVYLPYYERNHGRKSKVQLLVENYLSEIGVEFESEAAGKFLKFNKFIDRDYCPRPDILLKNKKIVIEIYGDRWHGNPKMYRAHEIIKTWKGRISVREIHKFDKIRQKHIESFGYKVIILWERDIRRDFNKIQKSLDFFLKPC